MKWKAFAAAALSLVGLGAGNGAYAAIAANTDNSGQSEVFFAVWDTSNGKTYIQDLGIAARTTDWVAFATQVISDRSFTVDSTTYNGLFGTSNASDLRWGVYSASTSSATSADLFFTAATNFNVTDTGTGSHFTGETALGGIAQNIKNLDDLTNAHNSGSVDYAANLFTGVGSAGNAGSIGLVGGDAFSGNFVDDNAFGTFTMIGQALKFFRIGFDTAGYNNSLPDIRLAFTTWAFNGTTLTYGAVPLPAGLWLLGSALLGLVGVSRRRVAAVTA